MNRGIESLDHEGLIIQPVFSGESVTLIWQGHCESRTPEAVFSPYFKNLIPVLKGKKLIVDFRPFEYMSSAMQSPILQFLKNLEKNHIPTRVLYTASLEWQRISYRCMKVLFRAMPQIQFECT